MKTEYITDSELTEDVAFVKNNLEYLDKEDIAGLYKKFGNEMEFNLISGLTKILFDADINPFEFVSTIIENSLYRLSTDVLDLQACTNLITIDSFGFQRFTVDTLILPNSIQEINAFALQDMKCRQLIFDGTHKQWLNIKKSGQWDYRSRIDRIDYRR